MSRVRESSVVPWRLPDRGCVPLCPGRIGKAWERSQAGSSSSSTQRTGHDPAAPTTDRRWHGLFSTKKGSLDSHGKVSEHAAASRRPARCDDGRGRVAARPRHRANVQWVATAASLPRQPDRFRDGVIADLTRRAGAGFHSYRPVEALRCIAATPLAHGSALASNRGERRSPCSPTAAETIRARRQPLRRLATTRQNLQIRRARHRSKRSSPPLSPSIAPPENK